MKTFKKTILISLTMSVFSFPAKQAQATAIDDPFAYYNVFSAGDINYTNSGFNGTVGAGGKVLLTGVALNSANQFALHAGGDVSISGGNHTGSIETAGNVTLGNLAIHGSVYSGGTVANSAAGNIYGDVSAQNIALDSRMSVAGTRQSGATYTPNADLGAAATYFRTFSQDVAAKGPTGVTVTNSGGWLQTSTLSSGVNVVTLSASALNNAYRFTVNGPADAKLYINVPGAQVALNSTEWLYQGGIASPDVLVNYFEAFRLDLTSTNIVNVLAPLAFTSFIGGSITGSLIVGDLSVDRCSVNLVHFDPGEPVPEPSTLLLLLAGGLPFLLRKKLLS